MDFDTQYPHSSSEGTSKKAAKRALKRQKALAEQENNERLAKKIKSAGSQGLPRSGSASQFPRSCVSQHLAQDLKELKQQTFGKEDKENHQNGGVLRKKKKKQQVVTGSREPLSPHKPPIAVAKRSTSAAAAMAKIASINAQTAATARSFPEGRFSFSTSPSETTYSPRPSLTSSLRPSLTASPQPSVTPSPVARSSSPRPSLTASPTTISIEADFADEDNTSPGRPSLAPADLAAFQPPQASVTALSVDSSSSADLRLSVSERMALEAEKLQLSAQIEAERASVEVKELSLRADKDAAQRQAEDTQLQVMQLAKMVKELQDRKEEEERARAEMVPVQALRQLQSELQKFKSTSDSLQSQVTTLKQEVDIYKQETISAERQLSEQKEINRRLSARLSGHFSTTGGGDCCRLDDVADLDDLDQLIGRRDSSSWELKSVDAATSPIQLPQPSTPHQPSSSSSGRRAIPTTPGVQHSTVLPSEADSSRRASFFTVPTVTPSKAHAPAVYNERMNREKKSEYAHMLTQQIEEKREKKRNQNAMDHAASVDYFPFGRPGSGAPVRDANSNVVANVTFSRSRKVLPVDHPAGPLYAKRSASQEVYNRKRMMK